METKDGIVVTAAAAPTIPEQQEVVRGDLLGTRLAHLPPVSTPSFPGGFGDTSSGPIASRDSSAHNTRLSGRTGTGQGGYGSAYALQDAGAIRYRGEMGMGQQTPQPLRRVGALNAR